MKIDRTSRVHTQVQWKVTLTMDEDEFSEMISHLPEEWQHRLTIGAPEPDGQKRPITELKRKAAQFNGG